jgi:hypothetical protein
MKKYTFFLLILGLLAACESPDVCTGNCANKRIRFIDDGVHFNRIVYDDDNRQTYFIQAIDSISRYSYDIGSSTATLRGGPNGDTDYITDETIVSGMSLVTRAAGQQIKSIQRRLNNPTIILNTSIYTWYLGNLVKTISTNTGAAPVTTNFTYYPNITNTVSNEFNGLRILGKTSDKAQKTTVTNGVTANYTYDINECGCITQTTRSSGTGNIVRKYTYELIPR